ncbi:MULTISPECIES: patatin-like phospholipase family protein [Dethiosulfovibrio]|uniref:Patatin-like phospholipase family protein n=2 Tax=Dethiosulfovibrio TaxID=47054 RepID=A0ABS9EQC6_9BACT|nr:MULTISPECIES: patatin-like phospholipase family protein [Dethiosulfovibrio]MCF4114951.1 patatin-like phospholipase family protein [Dethiosulfovibrio russensis]MCF4143393.1 patatin-like phospholipase family protein [Dethiosulfovibrio marinus]MCF4146001.1 patatin-like phospholipase family protein [Dethiosulfovibrio acidaminovorans]
MSADLRDAVSKDLKIGLALGGGAARGCAHIGVLRALEEKSIPVGCIAGTSIGAMVGAVYASGGMDHLEELLLKMDLLQLLSYFDVVFPHSGLVDGRKVTELLRGILGDRSFDDLSVPFAAVATDLRDGSEVVLSSGDVIDAVRASIAVPGVFTPFVTDDALLVDGGLVDPVPVNVVRSLGAEFVIAVDLNRYVVGSKQEHRTGGGLRRKKVKKGDGSSLVDSLIDEISSLMNDEEKKKKSKGPGLIDVMVTSINIMESSITENKLKVDSPELLIAPKLGHIRFMEFFRAEEAMEVGYRAAMDLLY